MDDLMKLTKLELVEEVKSLKNSIDNLRTEARGFKDNWKAQAKETASCKADIEMLKNKLSRIQQSIETVLVMRYPEKREIARHDRPMDTIKETIDMPEPQEEARLLLYLQREAGWYGHQVSGMVDTCEEFPRRHY